MAPMLTPCLGLQAVCAFLSVNLFHLCTDCPGKLSTHWKQDLFLSAWHASAPMMHRINLPHILIFNCLTKSFMCRSEVMGQWLRQLLTTFTQNFCLQKHSYLSGSIYYYFHLICHVNMKRIHILHSFAPWAWFEQYFELWLVILLLFWCENTTVSFLPSVSSMAASSPDLSTAACLLLFLEHKWVICMSNHTKRNLKKFHPVAQRNGSFKAKIDKGNKASWTSTCMYSPSTKTKAGQLFNLCYPDFANVTLKTRTHD